MMSAVDNRSLQAIQSAEFASGQASQACESLAKLRIVEERKNLSTMALQMYQDIVSKKHEVDEKAKKSLNGCLDGGAKLGVYPLIGVVSALLSKCGTWPILLINSFVMLIFLYLFLYFWAKLVKQAELELNDIYVVDYPNLRRDIDACLALIVKAKDLARPGDDITSDENLQCNLFNLGMRQKKIDIMAKIYRIRKVSAITVILMVISMFCRDCWFLR